MDTQVKHTINSYARQFAEDQGLAFDLCSTSKKREYTIDSIVQYLQDKELQTENVETTDLS